MTIFVIDLINNFFIYLIIIRDTVFANYFSLIKQNSIRIWKNIYWFVAGWAFINTIAYDLRPSSWYWVEKKRVSSCFIEAASDFTGSWFRCGKFIYMTFCPSINWYSNHGYNKNVESDKETNISHFSVSSWDIPIRNVCFSSYIEWIDWLGIFLLFFLYRSCFLLIFSFFVNFN